MEAVKETQEQQQQAAAGGEGPGILPAGAGNTARAAGGIPRPAEKGV